MITTTGGIPFHGKIKSFETGKVETISKAEDLKRLDNIASRIQDTANFEVSYLNEHKGKKVFTIDSNKPKAGRLDVILSNDRITVLDTEGRAKIWTTELYSVYTPSLNKKLKAAKETLLGLLEKVNPVK